METPILTSPTAAFSFLFTGAVFLSWVVTRGVRSFGARFEVLAKRDSRRRHDRDVPLLGGTAFYLVLMALTAAVWAFPGVFAGVSVSARSAFCFGAALTLVFGIGVVDDVFELKAPPKFAAQLAAAAILLLSKPHLPELFHDTVIPQWLVAPLLAIWIVGITNAVNMIDGLDGLCAGIVGISSFTLAMIMAGAGPATFPLLLTLALAGCCVGFLFHNFNPAKIFLGDSGSMLLGFVLAVVSVEVDVKRSLFVSLSIPIFLLGLPLLDIGLSVIRRKRRERSLFQGDRSHIHHRLQQVGLSHRAAVLLLWTASGYLNLVAFFLAQVPASHSFFLYAAVTPTLAFWLVALYFVEYRLSVQAAHFSHLFLRQETQLFAADAKLLEYLGAQLSVHENLGKPFTVVVLDSAEFLKQMGHERPARVVEFYMNLYSILRGRLRDSDLVARVPEYRVVAVLAGAGGSDGSDGSVIDYLRTQVKELQEAYGIFQSHPRNPEGFRVFKYPRDSRALWARLGVDPANLPRPQPVEPENQQVA